ncbi:MAG: hypothetical protein WB615_14470 [Candidatus Tumulicola sp.]
MRTTALSFCGVIALLVLAAACGGESQLPPTPSHAASSTHNASWIDPNAVHQDLMYVSNWRTGVISILTYPQGKSVGAITGFSEPEGECVDAHGDVFIADRARHQIQEYAHGGTVAIQTLSYLGASPYGCSVDPVSGDLAVTNGGRSKHQQSVLAIYAKATGAPKLYDDDGFNAEFCGYDNQGNLYVDGQSTEKNSFKFAELPKGDNAIVPVTLNKSFGYPGSVQWDGTYLMVADSFPPVAYRFTFSSGGGTAVGSPTKFGSLYEVAQLWIQGDKILGADGNVFRWNYPAGRTKLNTYEGFSDPVAAVVSPASK